MAALSTLVDDFDDNAVDPVRWPGNYGTVTEAGGRARLTCDTSYNAFVSASTYSFDSFFLRAYPAAASGAASSCYLSVFLASAAEPAGTNVGLVFDTVANSLSLISWVGFSDAGTVTLTYDPTAHAWVRVAASGGTLVWQTSPDGSTWTTRRSTAVPGWLAAASDVRVFFEAHRDSGTPNAAEVDNFNIAPFSTISATGAASLGGLAGAGSSVRSTPAAASADLAALTAAASAVRTVPATATTTLGGLTAAATARSRWIQRPYTGTITRPDTGVVARP